MAKKVDERSIGAVVALQPEPVIVNVSSELRQSNQWFEDAAQPVKAKALAKKKAELKKPNKKVKKQPAKLSDQKLSTTWKLLRRLESRLKTLQKRCSIVRNSLAVHYSYLDVEKWLNELQESLGWPTYKLGIDQNPLVETLDAASLDLITTRTLQMQLLLAMIAAGQTGELKDKSGKPLTTDALRKLVTDNIVVTETPSIKVAAPSKEGEAAKKQAA